MNVLLFPSFAMCGDVSLFIFLEKTKQKIVVAPELLCFQGRSPQQGMHCMIDGGFFYE